MNDELCKPAAADKRTAESPTGTSVFPKPPCQKPHVLWLPMCHQACRASSYPVARLALPITCKGNVLTSAVVELNSIWSELQMAGQIWGCLPHKPKKEQKGELFFDDWACILKAFSGRCVIESSRIGSHKRQPNLCSLIYLQLYCKKKALPLSLFCENVIPCQLLPEVILLPGNSTCL